jgi:hypothetical protein
VTEAEFRDFMREQTLRHERAMREVIRRTDEMVRRSDVQIDTLNDLVEESRAQRAALFAMIDRLGPGPASA